MHTHTYVDTHNNYGYDFIHVLLWLLQLQAQDSDADMHLTVEDFHKALNSISPAYTSSQVIIIYAAAMLII